MLFTLPTLLALTDSLIEFGSKGLAADHAFVHVWIILSVLNSLVNDVIGIL